MYQAVFSGTRTWTYQDFRPWQIENRMGTIPAPVPPELVPCPSGKFTFYQECCSPYAYSKNDAGRCEKNVPALFDGVKDYVVGQPAGAGYLKGTETITNGDGTSETREVTNIINGAFFNQSIFGWPSNIKDSINTFTVYCDLGDYPVPYDSTETLTGNGLIDFSSGTVFRDGPSIFYFGYRTALSGAEWRCFDNVNNMMFSSTANLSATHYPYLTNEWKFNLTAKLTLT
jgi:hypothetical protein